MKLSKTKIALIRKYFESKPVRKAYLFGSYSRGEATTSSDLDILVELDYRHKIGLEFVQMKLDLEALLHTDVDLVSEKGLSPRIRPMIMESRQLIYAR